MTTRALHDGEGVRAASTRTTRSPQHRVNQQLFAVICATSIGVAPDLDPTACLANIFGSPSAHAAERRSAGRPRVVVALNTIARGDTRAALAGDGSSWLGPIGSADGSVQRDDPRGVLQRCAGKVDGRPEHRPERRRRPGLRERVRRQPAASTRPTSPTGRPLLRPARSRARSPDASPTGRRRSSAAGRFYSTSCDLDGVDVLNMEASVFFQSFPNVPRDVRRRASKRWDTTDEDRAQPGTVGFQGGAALHALRGRQDVHAPRLPRPGRHGYNVEDRRPHRRAWSIPSRGSSSRTSWRRSPGTS